MSNDHAHYFAFPPPVPGAQTVIGRCTLPDCGATSERMAWPLDGLTAKERHNTLGLLTTGAKSVPRWPFPVGREQGGR